MEVMTIIGELLIKAADFIYSMSSAALGGEVDVPNCMKERKGDEVK